MIWQDYFTLNRIIILSIYGQVFFVLGLAILLQSRRHSRLKLARDLRWLALFGLLHALHEWGLVFIPIQAEYLPAPLIAALLAAQIGLLAASFVCLLVFGVVLLEEEHPAYRWLAVALVGVWFAVSAVAYLLTPGLEEWIQLANIWARYLLAFPGACLAAAGLYRQSKTDVIAESGPQFNRMLRWASYSLLAYGFVAGLVVPAGPFFPANTLNQSVVEDWFGVPIEVFRSLAGLLLTVSVIRALELFVVEVDRLIETMEVEAIQVSERDRIGQEIHDGAMQGMYSVGLILNSMEKHVDSPAAQERLEQAERVLERVILDLRHYMTSLRIHPPVRSLAEELALLVNEPRFRSLIDVDVEISTHPTLEPDRAGHLLGLVQEALSNAGEACGGQVASPSAFSRRTVALCWRSRTMGKALIWERSCPGSASRRWAIMPRLLDYTMTINSAPGRGTVVVVKSMEDLGA